MADIRVLQEFYENLRRKGRLLNHLFQISVTKSGMEDLQLFGQSTVIPARVINTTQIAYLGQEFDIPTTLDEGRTWRVELTTDKSNDIYNAILNWQAEYASLINSGGGYKGISPETGYIELLNHGVTSVVDGFSLAGVFPKEVGDLVLDSTGGGELATFSVDFTFQYRYNSAYLDPVR